MQIIWRTLPRLALPAAIGLGVAYLATSFMPRPAPNLRPPEELRAVGQGYAEESPVRTILERNVLKIEGPLFYPLGQPPAPIPAPEAAAPAVPPQQSAPGALRAAPPAQAAFAPADTRVAPPPPGAAAGLPASATAPISGGPSVQGLASMPAPAPTSAPAPPAPAPSLSAQPQPASAARASASGAAQPRAAAPAAQPAPQAAPGLGIEGFRLVGVIAGGERPLAMFQVDGAAVSLRPGEQVRGWTLVSVEPRQALLRQGETLRRVVLGAPRP